MEEAEIWKQLYDYEGYEVSNFGRIRSKTRTLKYNDGTSTVHKGKPIQLKRTVNHNNAFYMLTINQAKVKIKIVKTVADHFLEKPSSKNSIATLIVDEPNFKSINIKWLYLLDDEKAKLEKWVQLYEHKDYEISNFGRVRCISRNKPVKVQTPNGNKQKKFCFIYPDRVVKIITMRKAVADHFVPKPNDGCVYYFTRYISDTDFEDRYDNIKWVKATENFKGS